MPAPNELLEAIKMLTIEVRANTVALAKPRPRRKSRAVEMAEIYRRYNEAQAKPQIGRVP